MTYLPRFAFEIFKMDQPFSDLGFVESPAGEVCLEAERVERLVTVYDRLRAVALSGPDATAFISKVAKGMR